MKHKTVGEVMTPGPFVVHKDRHLMDVIGDMISHKYGTAVVIDDKGQPCGIFTPLDALIVLQNYIRKNETELDSFHLT